MGRGVPVWSCPCGYSDEKKGMRKHLKTCKVYNAWHKRDIEFRKKLGLKEPKGEVW